MPDLHVPYNFISLYWIVITFTMRLESSNYYLNMSHGKMSDFVSFPLFGFNLVVKPRNFDFKANGQEIFLCNPQKSSVNVCLLKTLKKTLSQNSF